MSSLPPEIFDIIVDFLHDEPETLKACCIASKAWIYRTRRHLFNHVKFHPRGRHVSHWGETFPDPAQNSPAHHAQILSIGLSKLITAADINTLLTFCRISHLNVDTLRWHHQPFSLLPLHAFFPTIRSLHLRFSSGQVPKILGLICSFLDLDDLALVGYDSSSRGGAWSTPSISPRLAGSLELRGGICIQPITRDLLDFPNGLQFKKIVVGWSALGAVESTVELVSRCSDTLEYLKITNFRQDPFKRMTLALDLSKATKLKVLEFGCKNHNVEWISAVLHTAQVRTLRRISLVLSRDSAHGDHVSALSHHGWATLDGVLVQLWNSYSLRPKLMYDSTDRGSDLWCDVARLLPGAIIGGIVDFVEDDACCSRWID